jgi:predicted tellurium resistance membrane protein TerC
LIDKVPELETAAYVLIGFIAIKMLMAVAGIDIPSAIFFAFILLIFGTTIVFHLKKSKKLKEHG